MEGTLDRRVPPTNGPAPTRGLCGVNSSWRWSLWCWTSCGGCRPRASGPSVPPARLRAEGEGREPVAASEATPAAATNVTLPGDTSRMCRQRGYAHPSRFGRWRSLETCRVPHLHFAASRILSACGTRAPPPIRPCSIWQPTRFTDLLPRHTTPLSRSYI